MVLEVVDHKFKMKKIFIIICFFCVSSILRAQSLEERYRAFQQAAKQNYTDFRDAANADYINFLRAAWEYYKVGPVIERPEEDPVPPTPYEAPVVTPDPQPLPYEEVAPIPAPQPQPEPISPIMENDEQTVVVKVSFYGTNLSFRHPRAHRLSLRNPSPDIFANAWGELSEEQYDNLIYDCLKASEEYQLCDWGYAQMLKALSEQVYGASNEAVFLRAFIFAQSGYAMRLAMSEAGKLYMLIGSEYQLYDQRYFEIDGLYFYPMEEIEDGLHICSGAFEKEQQMSIYINPEQRLTAKNVTTPVRKSEQGVVASCIINQNSISFYNDYPTGQIGGDCGTRWATYANAPMEECVRLSLYPALRNAIRGVPEKQAVEKLLNWVQTAFEYEYDDKVWGQDRAFFPSESLYYPYADCEDRAILFSRIVRDLLGLDVVLLYYPGHLAAAVCFNQVIAGDYVMLNDRKFIVCDPTYIGAPIGATMPGMDNKTAKVIPLSR